MIQVCDPPRQRQVRRLSAEEFFTLVRCGGAGFYRPRSEVLRMLTAGEAWGTAGAALLVLPLTADTAAANAAAAHSTAAAAMPKTGGTFSGDVQFATKATFGTEFGMGAVCRQTFTY